MLKKYIMIFGIFIIIIICLMFPNKSNAAQQTIADGIYEIETGVDSDKALDVINGVTYSGGNVQIFTKNNANCQKINVKYVGDGYYTLSFVHSGKYLDVSNANTRDGTNVWQCIQNESDAQKWIIKDTGDGYYNIISKCSNTYLTIENGNTSNCTNIEINSFKNNNSQKFKFNLIKKIIGKQTISDGIYEIETGVDSDKALDVINGVTYSGGNVQIFTKNNAKCQKINVKYVGDGYYTLSFIHSGKYLDVSNGNIENGTNVWQCTQNESDAQKWVIKDTGDGYYNIISKCSNTYLTVENGHTNNCTNIEINSKQNNNSQKFKFNSMNIIGKQTITDGIYEIETGVDSSKSLDVINSVQTSGGNVQIFTKNNANCQKINVKYVGDGYYTLEFIHSKKYLDVSNGNIENGTNVWQCTQNKSDAQKWVIKDAGNGYYNIISKCSNTYLTVENGNTSNCTNIEINSFKDNNSQKFKFNSTNVQRVQTIADGIYEIETGVDSNKVLDVINSVQTSGGNVQIFTRNNANCQKINVNYIGDGYYTLKFMHSGKYLDVSNGNIENGTNVWQCTGNGSDAQKWGILYVGDGYYKLISKCSNTYLTVAGGNITNCTNIEINSSKNDNSQKFRFNATKLNFTIDIDENKYPGYKEKIEELKAEHSNWNFLFLYTGITFANAVNGEASVPARNLVPTSYAGEWINGYTQYDSGWYAASAKAIAYYMDPRNFLDDVNIFQFLDENGYPSEISVSNIQTEVNNTYLSNYANDIYTACKNQGVNPYYIISRLIQEQGKNGTTIGKGMDGGDGYTYYNPFDIGASGNGYSEIYANALARAKSEGWNTMEKAIEGGITYCKKNWLDNYQNTLYQNRFDIDSTNGTSLYSHQYMQNLMGAYSEARLLKGMYNDTGCVDSTLTFIIPLYENMDSTVSPLPSSEVESYPMDFETTGTGVRLRESPKGNIICELAEKGTKLISAQRGVSSDWQKVITTDGKIGYVSCSYLTSIDTQTNCNHGATVKTNDGKGCNVRVGPSTRTDQLTAISDGASVTVINEGTYNNIDGYNWSRVVLASGAQGFMPSQYLK